MDIELKFRHAIFRDGKFHSWHYWGFVNDEEGTKKDSHQFTGRLDKNGKEIYRNSILYDAKFTWKCIVCFGESEFGLGWYIKTIPTGHIYKFDTSISKLKIIGNTTENPELIEGNE